MFNGSINSELYFIYGLIAIVVMLIIIVIIIDKKDQKKNRRRVRLSDTLNMKPITEDMLRDKNYKHEYDEINMINDDDPDSYVDSREIPQIKIDLRKSGLISDDYDDKYEESDLEKTQAQIRVEEITKALEEAGVDSEDQVDRYSFYEEEQEKNAIISYEELANSYDKLYEENEKQQYIDDATIPINIRELYELTDKEEEYVKEYVNKSKPVIKHTDYISPVYGIHDPNETGNDRDLENANKFLNTLKELKSSLE